MNPKLLTYRNASSNPANTVNSPLNGFARKNSSNTACRSCVPFLQYAYAIVSWYVSVSSAVTSALCGAPSTRASASMATTTTTDDRRMNARASSDARCAMLVGDDDDDEDDDDENCQRATRDDD